MGHDDLFGVAYASWRHEAKAVMMNRSMPSNGRGDDFTCLMTAEMSDGEHAREVLRA